MIHRLTIDLKMWLIHIRELFMYSVVLKILPDRFIYWLVNQTLQFVAPTVPALLMFGEMRRRGLLDYYCFVYMATLATTGVYSRTIVPELTVGQTLERFKRIL